MTDNGSSWRISALARDLRTESGFGETADHVADATRDLVDGCDHASITVARRDGQVETLAASDETARNLDAVQELVGQGPCLDALWDEELVVAEDLAHERRWPQFARAAVARYGVLSALCVRLFTNETTVGALNLFSRQVDGFSNSDRQELQAIAAQGAVAMAAAKEIEVIHAGLDSRAVIGQATGVLMVRYGLSPGAAFALLTRYSSHQNRKLRDIALDVVEGISSDV